MEVASLHRLSDSAFLLFRNPNPHTHLPALERCSYRQINQPQLL